MKTFGRAAEGEGVDAVGDDAEDAKRDGAAEN